VVALGVLILLVLIVRFLLLRNQIGKQYEKIRAQEVKQLEQRAEVAELLGEIEFVRQEREQRAAVEKELADTRKRLGEEVVEQRERLTQLEKESRDQREEIEP